MPFFLIVLLISFPLLLESYLDIGWIGIALYIGIAMLLFGIAWIPGLLNQWIARSLLREKAMSGRQQAHHFLIKSVLSTKKQLCSRKKAKS